MIIKHRIYTLGAQLGSQPRHTFLLEMGKGRSDLQIEVGDRSSLKSDEQAEEEDRPVCQLITPGNSSLQAKRGTDKIVGGS